MRSVPGGRRLDVLRAAAALSTPGIDPSMHISYATVDDDDNAISIEAGGVFVDVTLHPSEKSLTCRYVGMYSAPGGAVYFPIRRGDEVAITNGDEREGPLCTLRCHNEVDTFPLTVNGRDVTGDFPFVKIESGDWEIEVAGEVHLQGGADAPKAAREGDAIEATPMQNAAWAAWLAAVGTGSGAGAPPTDAIPGTVTSGSSKVKIGG